MNLKHVLNRMSILLSQAVFSAITPPLLVPKVARLSFVRTAVAFCFGRLYGNRYDEIIDAFGDRYEAPMAKAIARSKELHGDGVSVVLDSGTGTGFVTRQASAAFPGATFIACDLLPSMLRQARDNCAGISDNVLHVQADAFNLPLADCSVDIVLVQNTMPSFHEYCRVLRAGGTVLYVDTAAGWIAGLAERLIRKNLLFDTVVGGKVGIGFYVLAVKASEGVAQKETAGPISPYSFLRCPLDRAPLEIGEAGLVCKEGHHFAVVDGIPLLLQNIPNRK